MAEAAPASDGQVPAPPATPRPAQDDEPPELEPWQWSLALALGVGSAVAGVLAVFSTDNEVGSAALLTVAVYLLLAGTLRRFPRLKIGDNEIDPEARKLAKVALDHAAVADSKAADAGVTAARAREDATDAKEGLAATAQSAPDAREPVVPLDSTIRSLADEYNRTRWTMPSGPDRTRRMTDIVQRMIAHFRDAGRPDVDALLGSDDRGVRLAGVAAVYAQPSADDAPALVEAGVTEDKPFNEYWTLLALEKSLVGNCDRLRAEDRERLLLRRAALPPGIDRARIIDRILAACP